MDKEILLGLYKKPLNELLKLAAGFVSNNIEFCSLVSARTGKCTEGCRYCAQSSHYQGVSPEHPLVSVEEVLKVAKEAKSNGASRFAIVTSGRTPADEDMDTMCEMIKAINSIGLKSCASLGLLTFEQAKRFKDAGLVRYHHNINTSKSYHSEITTTHTYEDRIETIKNVKKAGLELCCGVILGMGESSEQRVEMALELAEISPESIPLNILMPIKGTPFGGYFDKIDEENILRTIAVFKIANSGSIVRFCGGRNTRLSASNRELALENCVEGVLIGNYLTTLGITPQDDIETLKKLGKTLYV